MNRYKGLDNPNNINPILNGDALTQVRLNKPYEEVYQLGWSSAVFFENQSGNFINLDIRDLQKNTVMLPAQPISQIATRGVNACTAIAIMRGNFMCLMHLDHSDLKNDVNKNTIINWVNNHLSHASENIYMIASHIPDADETAFVNQLSTMCTDLGTARINIINRGRMDSIDRFVHVEFGIAIDKNSPVVYGDKTRFVIEKEFIIPFTANQEYVDDILRDPPEKKCIIV